MSETMQQTSVIEVLKLTVTYDNHKAIDDLSLQIPTGSVVGLLGRNGAGKSTLIRTLLGFSEPTQGSCFVLGEDSRTISGQAKARLGIVLQNPQFYNWLTGTQLIKYTASFYPRWNTPLAERLVHQWDVPVSRALTEYSPGQMQKLACILALSHSADLYVLDEPASALDPVSRRQLLAELIEIAGGEGKTILFSTHIVSDLERIADRVMILDRGRLKLDEPLDALKESVKRLRFFGPEFKPLNITHPSISNIKRQAGCTLALTTGFTGDLRETLEKQAGCPVQVEDLSLEEIFLELSRD